jgi:hypothetical protein
MKREIVGISALNVAQKPILLKITTKKAEKAAPPVTGDSTQLQTSLPAAVA